MKILQVKFPLTTYSQDSINASQKKNKSTDRTKFKRRINIADLGIRERLNTTQQDILQIKFEQLTLPQKAKGNLNVFQNDSNPINIIRKNQILNEASYIEPKCYETVQSSTESEVQQKKQPHHGKLTKLQVHFKNVPSLKLVDFSKSVKQINAKHKHLSSNISKPHIKVINEFRMTPPIEGSTYKQFQFSLLKQFPKSPREQQTQQLSSSKNLFFDDEVATSYQNNILKTILTIKRNNILDLISHSKSDKNSDRLSSYLSDSKQVSHRSIPRIMEKDEFTYFKVLKLPYHWNDNYYQTQKVLRDEKTQSLQKQVRPSRKNIRENSTRIPRFKYQKTNPVNKNDNLFHQSQNQQRTEEQPIDSPKLCYGEIIHNNQISNRRKQHIIPEEGFGDNDEQQQEIEDYFHYYVKSQKE